MEKLNTELKRQIIRKSLQTNHYRLILNTISFLCLSISYRVTSSTKLQVFDIILAIFVLIFLVDACSDIRKDYQELKKLKN